MNSDIDFATNPFFHYEMDKICAVCNKRLIREKHSILSNIPGNHLKVTVIEELESICDFKFGEGPQYVCADCYHNTVAVFRFRVMCNSSHENHLNFLQHQETMKNKELEKKKRKRKKKSIGEQLKEPEVHEIQIKEEPKSIEEIIHYKHVGLDDITFHGLKENIDMTNITPSITDMEEEIIIELPKEDTTEVVNEKLRDKAEEIILEVSHKEHKEEIKDEEMNSKHQAIPEKDLKEEIVENQLDNQDTDDVDQINEMDQEDCAKSDKKNIKCKVCHKVVRANYLPVHMRSHTGEKPYQCKHCLKAFSTSTTLKMHETIHAERRNYVCGYCGNSFKLMATLKIHERTHTGEKPFPCGLCDMSFSSSSRRKQHQTVHTGSRNFQCELCPKSFTRLTVLKDHHKSHAGIKDFACGMCGKRFTQRHTQISHEAYRCKVKKELIDSVSDAEPIVYVIEQVINE